MKIHLFFLSVLIFIFFYPNGLNAQCHDKQQRTIEELTKIAKKYGVADRVSINTGLMFCDLDFVEKHKLNFWALVFYISGIQMVLLLLLKLLANILAITFHQLFPHNYNFIIDKLF